MIAMSKGEKSSNEPGLTNTGSTYYQIAKMAGEDYISETQKLAQLIEHPGRRDDVVFTA